ncbi:MAG: ComEA family DNA-binding protein [Bacilli bacterium]|nr:ComEA family DNA-binding protein [Bacilli bacterium]
MIKLIIGAVIAVFVVIGGFLLLDPNVNKSSVNNTVEVADTATYTIEGEVSKVGTYTLSDVVTMADLIAAAGGATSNADPLAYFEDATLTSGNTYFIAPQFDSTDICGTSPIAKVNVNADDAETLMKVNGITSSIASSIVSYRTENGTFSTLEDLLNVYGIGNATYRKIRSYIILHE